MTQARGVSVLVVEDDKSMRESIERLLVAADFMCTTFASAEALLSAGVDERAACVVSDLKLPDMSGLELLAVLRVRRASLPFILITGHDAPGLRQKALELGASAYLPKPFFGTALLEALKRAIANRVTEGPHRENKNE